MNVCLVSARFPPQRCGVGDYTYFLAGALGRMGHEVHVLTAPGDNDESLYPAQHNVSLHRVVRSWEVTGLRDVVRQIRSLDPHALLIQYTPHSFDRRGITFAVNLVPALIRARKGIRVITNFHELYIPFGLSPKRNLGALWQRSAAMVMAWGSHAISVTAREWERRLQRMGVRRRIETIPVGGNIPQARLSRDERDKLRKQLLGSSDGLLVAGFGAWHDRDVPSVLSALRSLKRLGRAKLVWIGGGVPDERHRVGVHQAMRTNDLDENDVEWTGMLPHDQVSRLLSACDIMTLPFIDGVSTRRTSAVTALQHGLPLLTTRGSQHDPWFVHGENAYLLPVGDGEALANGLVELGEKPEMRTRLSQGGRALYKAHFAWDVLAKHVIGLAQADQHRGEAEAQDSGSGP